MEYLDVCDEQGIPTGAIVDREEAHRKGIMHRTAHVWIIREESGRTEILLQKRSENKESFPGKYDTSSAGHIPAGEEPLPSARRELLEELGIQAAAEDLDFAGRFHSRYEKEFHGRVFRDNEITSVFVYRKEVKQTALVLQKDEVEAVRWFDLEAVLEEIRHSRERICVPSAGLQVLKKYLERKTL